jgi:hypothetical protein
MKSSCKPGRAVTALWTGTVTLHIVLLAAALPVFAQSLPTFQEFRRIDRLRRLTGQVQSEESLAVMRVNPSLMERTIAAHTNDATVLWGAAELQSDWPKQRALFEQAIAVGGTNAAIALRFAQAACRQGELDAAKPWIVYCQKTDKDNFAPWLVELWMLRKQKKPLKEVSTPSALTLKLQDYSVAASRARIRFLEAAGYCKYSARRVGFSPDSMLLTMARELGQPPVEEGSETVLMQMAQALQKAPPFLLTELIGQTLEGNLLAARPDAATSPEVRARNVEITERREDLKELLADVQRNAVDFATEAEMVQYFDTVLSDGEEAAMKWLLHTVRSKPSVQSAERDRQP